MRHSHTTRNYAKAFFAFAVLGLTGACADNATVAPAAEAPLPFVAPAGFARVGNSIVFRVNNSEGITKRLGSHVINIPAGAICDMATAGYGATTWDTPCDPHRGSVIITATILNDSDNQPYIDFQPALRFAPNKEVMLFLRHGRNGAGKTLAINYCNNLGYCFDESVRDPSLKPFRVGKTSIIGRRLKHFSGYAVILEGDCTGTVTPIGDGTFWCETGDGMTRRSGYMVASGEDVSEVMKDKDAKKDDQ